MDTSKLRVAVCLALAAGGALGAQFEHGLSEGPRPWTGENFLDDPQEFRFAIISDLTGGERPHVYERAVENLNLLRPEFVMSVGDLIQGGGVSREELLKQWKS